jgi:SAM-dependent methyltransferase
VPSKSLSMIVHRLRSFEDYVRHHQRMGPVYERRRSFESSLQPKKRRSFTVSGLSYPARRAVNFRADLLYSDGLNVNWRERLICPVTGLNNRLRAAVHLADSEIGIITDESIYITERVTPLYQYLRAHHAQLVGSEYLGAEVRLGMQDERGVRNEDLTRLTFPDDSFDVVLSFDCFEHMPDFCGGMREMARVTKPKGRMMWSVPFRADRETNLIRATISPHGSVHHYETPEYHGDPLNSQGCLCFTHFGWEMLDQVRRAGFTDAYAIAYWSDTFAYLGIEQLIFVAVR